MFPGTPGGTPQVFPSSIFFLFQIFGDLLAYDSVAPSSLSTTKISPNSSFSFWRNLSKARNSPSKNTALHVNSGAAALLLTFTENGCFQMHFQGFLLFLWSSDIAFFRVWTRAHGFLWTGEPMNMPIARFLPFFWETRSKNVCFVRLEVSLFVFLITGQVLRLSIQRGLREFFRFSKGASFPEMIREHLKPDPGSKSSFSLRFPVLSHNL